MPNCLVDLPAPLLERIDDLYPKLGYKTRAEFIRAQLLDACSELEPTIRSPGKEEEGEVLESSPA